MFKFSKHNIFKWRLCKKIYERHFNKKRKKIQIISSGNPRLDVLKQTTSKYFVKQKKNQK